MNSFSEEHVFTNSFSTATCYDWSYLVDTDNCVEDNLVMNEWLTADFMSLLEPSDAKLIGDCQLNQGTSLIQKQCNGKISCLVNITSNMTNWKNTCVDNHINEMNITYTCGKF